MSTVTSATKVEIGALLMMKSNTRIPLAPADTSLLIEQWEHTVKYPSRHLTYRYGAQGKRCGLIERTGGMTPPQHL